MVMDKFQFMDAVADMLEQCTSEKEIELKAKQMISIIENAKKMSISYFKLGILK